MGEEKLTRKRRSRELPKRWSSKSEVYRSCKGAGDPMLHKQGVAFFPAPAGFAYGAYLAKTLDSFRVR